MNEMWHGWRLANQVRGLVPLVPVMSCIPLNYFILEAKKDPDFPPNMWMLACLHQLAGAQVEADCPSVFQVGASAHHHLEDTRPILGKVREKPTIQRSSYAGAA